MPTTWIKMGVMGRLRRPTQKCLGRVTRLYYAKGHDFFITSLGEANHQPGSFHYIQDAFDFRQQNVAKQEVEDVVGDGFQVIKNDAKGIYHVERDG